MMPIRKRHFTGTCLIALLLVAATIGGCEKGQVLAPSDATLTLTASPSNLSAPVGDGFATSTIEARVYGAAGFPESNVAVTFSTSGGKLSSGGAPVDTDGSGVAKDTLILHEGDVATLPATFTVTAQSGTLTGTATVTVGCPGNVTPVAVITGSATGVDASGPITTTVSVDLDGVGSTDSDGSIVSYVWTCGNGDVATESTSSTVTCIYTTPATSGLETTYTATLVVKDNGNGIVLPGGGYACQASSAPATIQVRVTAE
jgi:hypothetical protein